MAAEIAQLEFESADLKIDKGQIQAEIVRYRTYIEQIPAVEQQLLILDREHDNLRGFYSQDCAIQGRQLDAPARAKRAPYAGA